ncbi:MAG TPA: DUF6265 family protein [Thermoanaerobaculia bacterium]|nr:DUF6265 family protein [Thermoanaerobaculia bacterium]
MRSRLTAALGLALLVSFPLLAQTPAPPKPTLKDLGFLAGHWVDSSERHLSEEVWSQSSGDSMVGMWRYMSEGKTKVIELLSIRDEAGGPVLRIRHFDADLVAREDKGAPVALPLVERSERYARFSGPAAGGKGAVTVSYQRDRDGLKATVTKDGSSEEFRFRQSRDEGPGSPRRWHGGGGRPAPKSEAPPSTGSGGA